MVGWAKLTPDERRKAREQYKELKQLPAEKRAANCKRQTCTRVTRKWRQICMHAMPRSTKK